MNFNSFFLSAFVNFAAMCQRALHSNSVRYVFTFNWISKLPKFITFTIRTNKVPIKYLTAEDVTNFDAN